MKNFIGIFLTCLVICSIFMFFFGGLVLNNIWAIITLIAFVLSVFITVLMKQELRMEELEKQMKQLKSEQDLENE